MDPAPSASANFLVFGESVRRLIRRLRLLAGLIGAGLLLVVVGACVGFVVRILRPTDGSMGAALASGIVAIVALAIGTIVLEVASRAAGKAETIELAVAAYQNGCGIAGGLNFLGGCVSVVVIFANGVTNGLWVPVGLTVTLNVLGMVLALPRVKHLRRLHFSPLRLRSHA